MRILQVNQCHYRRGGADVVYLNMIDLLQSYGHDVASLSTHNILNEESPYSKYFVSFYDLRKENIKKRFSRIIPYIYNTEAFNKTERLILDFKPDISHVHLFNSYLSVSVLNALHKYRIPIVYTVHDYKLLCPRNGFLDIKGQLCEACAKGSIFSCLKKKCSDGSIPQSAIITFEALYWKHFNQPHSMINSFHFVSNFCMNKHLEYFPQIKNRSAVFYNFTLFHSKPKHEKREKYYLYFGRLSPEKGIKTLIDAWKEMPSDMKLKIVGDGAMAEPLIQEVHNSRISNIEFLGYKKGNELYELIHGAYFVIVPSECFENNPMTIIESYSLGTPVIGANIGGIPEIIMDEITGYIFEAGNSMQLKAKIELANRLSSEEYLSFSNHASAFASENFSKSIFYDHLIELYNKTIFQTKNTTTN